MGDRARLECRWRALYRQLIANGMLSVDLEGFGGLQLTERSRPLLRGEAQLMIRSEPLARATNQRQVRRIEPPVGEDRQLWDGLRELRRRLADEQGVPPYVIFNDVTLSELVDQRPGSLLALSRVTGIGERKLERYGDAILGLLFAHGVEPAPEPAPLPAGVDGTVLSDTVSESLKLLRQGHLPAEIARQRGMTEGTIYNHLAKAIAAGACELEQVVPLDKQQLDQVIDVLMEQPAEENGALRPIYDRLGGEVDYTILRCVQSALAG